MPKATRARLLSAATAAGAMSVALLAAAPAYAATAVAGWEMGDTSGPMVDSARNHDGTVGSGVVRTGTSYRFPFVKPNSGYFPQHIVRVPTAPDLNPGTSVYAVDVRFRTKNAFGNMVQKGQAGSKATGYFKMEMPKGIVGCLFRGPAGSVPVNSGRALNDGQWHTVRCQRTSTGVTMTIDGSQVRTGLGKTGSLTNNVPLSIGGKSNCDGQRPPAGITCDYWSGEMDYVRISTGA